MKDHMVKLIEDKLGWGTGDTWGNKDFEQLSERIFKKTNKRLSVTTLKRIWGRAEWVANPSMATLDILSEFIGLENWREFVRANKQERPEQKVLGRSRPTTIWIVLISTLILAGSLLGFFWKTDVDNKKKKTNYKPEDFSFNSRPISTGIPNSVVFDYDVSAADDDAKIEIQQDWDDTKRMVINQKDSIATSIYFRPGFFKSKLVVDSTIVKENDVFIQTQDWLGLIEKRPTPIYLNKSDIRKENRMAISSDMVAQHNLDPRTYEVVVSFYQVKDFGELYTGNFEMSATIKNDFKDGISGACRGAQIFILYDGGAVGIPFAKKGCSSKLTLMTFEEFVDGKKNDLSGFGVDFSDYVELKCVSKNQKLDVLINNKPVYQMNVPNPALKIKGIIIHFEGAGSVQAVEFKNNNGIIYTSNFQSQSIP
ncbi:MAG: hypothetical protein ACR2MT_06055 [Aurantibacter sp.]